MTMTMVVGVEAARRGGDDDDDGSFFEFWKECYMLESVTLGLQILSSTFASRPRCYLFLGI